MRKGLLAELKFGDYPPLQWGRNLTVAEGAGRPGVTATDKASMGPQLDSCGRGKRKSTWYIYSMLQWGRNLTVAEGRLDLPPV